MNVLVRSRLDAVRDLARELGLDGILVSDPDNRYYVTGYLAGDHGLTESAGVALVGQDRAMLFTSPNNMEWATEEAVDFEVSGWTRPWEKHIGEVLTTVGWGEVGFEPESLTVASWQRIAEHSPGVSLKPMGGELDQLRWVKSDRELDLMQQAIAITDTVYEMAESAIEPGMTERDLASRIETLYRDHGADGAAFPTAVAFGPNGARPHHSTGDTRIAAGAPIVIDMGAKVSGYCADLTRTTWIGSVSEEVAHIYGVVAEAQTAALSATAAGVPAKAVDQAARTVLESAGYKEHIVHSVGHGLGIRVHDGPSVSIASDRLLDVGNVVTIEPGLYFPGKFGVRIEDVVVVENGGCRVLSKARKASI